MNTPEKDFEASIKAALISRAADKIDVRKEAMIHPLHRI